MSHDEIEHQGGIATIVARLAERVDAQSRETTAWRHEMAANITDLTAQVTALSSRLSETGKANWPLIISFITLLIVICGLVLYPLNQQLQEVRNDTRKHGDLRLHPVGDALIAGISTELRERAETNAKSISDLDQKQNDFNKMQEIRFDDKIAALEKRFNQVQEQGSPITRERLAILEQAVKSLGERIK